MTATFIHIFSSHGRPSSMSDLPGPPSGQQGKPFSQPISTRQDGRI